MNQSDLVKLKSGKVMRRWALKVHLEFHKDEENEVVAVFQEVPMPALRIVCGNYVKEGKPVQVYGEKLHKGKARKKNRKEKIALTQRNVEPYK